MGAGGRFIVPLSRNYFSAVKTVVLVSKQEGEGRKKIGTVGSGVAGYIGELIISR